MVLFYSPAASEGFLRSLSRPTLVSITPPPPRLPSASTLSTSKTCCDLLLLPSHLNYYSITIFTCRVRKGVRDSKIVGSTRGISFGVPSVDPNLWKNVRSLWISTGINTCTVPALLNTILYVWICHSLMDWSSELTKWLSYAPRIKCSKCSQDWEERQKSGRNCDIKVLWCFLVKRYHISIQLISRKQG